MVRNLLQKREGGFRPDPKFIYKWPTVILDWRYPDMCRKIQQTNSTASQIFWWWDEGKEGCCWLLLTTNGQQAIIARQKPMWERRSHTLPAYQNLAAAIISHQSWSSLAIYHILPCLIRLHCSVHRHSSCLVYELSPKLSCSSDFVVTPWISNRDAIGSKKSWQGLLSLPWETRSHIRQFQYSPGSTLYAGHSSPYNSSNMHPTMVQPILLASTNIQPVQAIRSVLSRCLHPRLQNCPLLRCGLGTEWLPTTRMPQTACIVYRN